MTNKSPQYLILAFVILLLFFPQAAMQGAASGLLLFTGSVLPALLPFMIAVSILNSSGSTVFLDSLLSRFTSFFNLPNIGSSILLSAVSGYPVGAKTAGMLSNQKQAECALLLCNLPSPMFIIGTVSLSMFANNAVIFPLLFSQYASAIICAYIFRDTGAQTLRPIMPTRRTSFAVIFTEALSDSVNAILRVGAIMLFFGVIVSILNSISAISRLPKILKVFVFGLLEMTTGSHLAADINSLWLVSFFTVFGGFSVMMQTLTFVPFGFSYIKKRALQGLIAAALTFALYSIV